jgi:hypothetical protein
MRASSEKTGQARARPWLGAWLRILLLVLLWRPDHAAAQFLSPGPLAAAHAKWEGDEKCETCHSAGKGVPNAKCNACHEPIAKAEAAGSGLHGRKFKGQPCAKCHSDHHGRGFAMIRWDPKAFNHDDTGWPLRGDHAGTPCASCHKTKSYIGLAQACTSCHKDPHENRFGSKCLTCHDEADWNDLRLNGFDHGLSRYPLRGAHATVKCADCHRGSPPKYKAIEFSKCTDCHKDPHLGKLGQTCEGCHSEADWHKIALKAGAHPWLSLANGHARTVCAKCHDRGNLQAPSRGRACVGCHAPVHEADFGKRCENCHEAVLWLGMARKVGLSAHAKTAYPLLGKHDEVPCAGCHRPALPRNARYRELAFKRCNDCHADAHAGRFQPRDNGECRACHSESGFRPALFGVALHATTPFPLAGHHVAVACSKCHQKEPTQGRRLDWTLSKTACADCHENPHGNQFAKEMQQSGCATCHTPMDWDIPKIDHSIWPLTGAHASTPCAACHSATEQDRKAGSGPSYRLAPRACDGCHDDVHRGQFRLQDPKKSCELCHSTAAFEIRDFPHERLTGYLLEGRHQTLACSKCHLTEPAKSGDPVVRYRLGYRRCRDCHADPHKEAMR